MTNTEPAEPTTVTTELAAMRRIVAIVDTLDWFARHRVLGWVADRYGTYMPTPDPTPDDGDGQPS